MSLIFFIKRRLGLDKGLPSEYGWREQRVRALLDELRTYAAENGLKEVPSATFHVCRGYPINRKRYIKKEFQKEIISLREEAKKYKQTVYYRLR